MLLPSVPWSKQQTLTAGREEADEEKTISCLRAHVIIPALKHMDNIPEWIATKTFFLILLILVNTGFISIALFLIYIHNTASKLFGHIRCYRMLKKMAEIQYAKESTRDDFPRLVQEKKSQEMVFWWQMFNNWFPNKETQICWTCPYLWCKSSHLDWFWPTTVLTLNGSWEETLPTEGLWLASKSGPALPGEKMIFMGCS